MTHGHRIVVVLPAFNAAKTLEKTYADIPKDLVSGILLVDDVSQDQTVEVARCWQWTAWTGHVSTRRVLSS